MSCSKDKMAGEFDEEQKIANYFAPTTTTVNLMANDLDKNECFYENNFIKLIAHDSKIKSYSWFRSEPGEKDEFKKLKNVFFVKNLNEACLKTDLIIIHTEWDEFKSIDFRKISRNKKLKIYDMRNLYSPKKMKNLGLNYYSIGR